VLPTYKNTQFKELNQEDYEEERLFLDKLERRKKSLNYFAHDGIVRITLTNLLTNPIFERAILAIIIISTIQLAIDNPLNDPQSVMSQSLSRLDYALTAAFTMELLLKVIAYGFVNCGSTSFIRNYWNVVDTFVVIITVRILSSLLIIYSCCRIRCQARI
jgi:hypothetical protein